MALSPVPQIRAFLKANGNWSSGEPGSGKTYFGPIGFRMPEDCVETVALWAPGADERVFQKNVRTASRCG